jgi:hypothetical protein
MATRNQIIGLLLLAFAGAGFACGDNSKDEAPPEDTGTFTRRDAGDKEEEDDASEEETGDAGDAGAADAASEDTLTASEKEAKASGWVAGCYKKPTTSEELLNSCATGWRLFDESLYPADWKKDQLPSLP